MQKTTKLSLVSIALLSSLHANETKTVELKPFTITSTAIQTDELKSTDAVEVYTAEDIQEAHVQNIYEFLNSQTSVITMPTYGNPFSQKLDMHGYGIGDGYQNIVINVNGRRINNIDMVAPFLSGISPDAISRIEIIKSSGIVTGGDGANAGVINITTKKNNDKIFTMYGGTYGTFDGSVFIGHSDEKVSLSFSGEAQKNNGIRHLTSAGNKDKSKLGIGSFDFAFTPIEELEFRANVGISKTDVNYAGALTLDEYEENPVQNGSNFTNQNYSTSTTGAGVSYFVNDNISINIDASTEAKTSDDTYYSSYGPYEYGFDYTNNGIRANIDYVNEFMEVVVGVDSLSGDRDSEGTSYTSATKTTKDNEAIYLMSQFYLGDATLKAGYRYETVSYTFANDTQNLAEEYKLNGAELGFNYALDEEKSLFVNYAHSFQAPDIDRFFSTSYPAPTYDPVTEFNEFIDPMEADSLTLGFNYFLPNNKFKISAYYIDLTDEIYYYSDPVNQKNTNIDKSHKYGLDLYNKYIMNDKFSLALNYNFVQAIIDEEVQVNDDYSGKDLPGVSNHNAKLTLNYTPNQNTTFTLTQVYRSEAYAANDFNNDFDQKQEAYNSTDISASFAKDNWEVFAKINNLFNQSNGLWIKDDAIYPVNFTTTAITGLKLKF